MRYLELLAPARNLEIGIAAINCGADAVYIAGPDFGARKAAGNSYEDIEALCQYAHKFGVKIYLTYNTVIYENEREDAHNHILKAQKAGADALIVRDPIIFTWDDITIPLHASTQCAIRDVDRALELEKMGASRLVLERELPLSKIAEISRAVRSEIECFVHGALCVCYSGDCRLSEYIGGRSADKGDCMQACRSLYDLVDSNGTVLLRNKAILSLKDFNLINRLEDLAEAGACSFKIEGRLKNASYVKNVVRAYDLALNQLIENSSGKYRRASFGRSNCGFTPDLNKTFNRGYTECFLDSVRGAWSSKDAPKSMGELVGTVTKIARKDKGLMQFELKTLTNVSLNNGDGFAFSTANGIVGFRADIVKGNSIYCKDIQGLKNGVQLYRNINSAFEKSLDKSLCQRQIDVGLDISIDSEFHIKATTEDDRVIHRSFSINSEIATNYERQHTIIVQSLSKHSGIYHFRVNSLIINTKEGKLPLLSSASLNNMRRTIAEIFDSQCCKSLPLYQANRSGEIYYEKHNYNELMRSKYCIRYELGLCLKNRNVNKNELFLVNNGRRFKLDFDCKACEMILRSFSVDLIL